MDRLRINITAIQDLNVSQVGKRVKGSSISAQSGLIGSAVDSAVGALGSGLIADMRNTMMRAGPLPVNGIGGGVGHLIKFPTSFTPFTIGTGAQALAAGGASMAGGMGVYYSNIPEFGLYGTVSAGIVTNIGASLNLECSYIFGPPSTLAGTCIAIGVSCDLPGPTVGGTAFFSVSGPPFTFLGLGMILGAGISALPADVSVMYSSTRTRRIA